ncbi:c-type cytochrome [Tellurirhabdus bombi]|uniref:c-type cytochrome n=1 Tax=Tellurirhabdus bombi TaxID=2907205 RepID=UPI001F1AA1E5|nr:c-type cytochrome [Tellurirhabdus bombi]
MKQLQKLLWALVSVLLLQCVNPKAYSPVNERIRAVTLAKSDAEIERGRYLVNHVAACMDCHSRRDYTRLAGPIVPGTLGAGGQKFGKELGLPGTVYGKNITPFALKAWSDQELLLAITAGVSKNGKPLFPMMPSRNYAHMAESDAKAVIAYLRTLEPVEGTTPPAKIAAPVRMAMRMMPHKAHLQTLLDRKNRIEYGKYLVTMAGCADCHTKRTMGMLVKKAAFSGGTEMQLAGGTVRSANVTPDQETGIGSWTKQDFIRRFKMYDPATYQAPAAGDGFNTMMPWTLYANMTEDDLGAIYEYLRTVKPAKNKVMVFTPRKP